MTIPNNFGLRLMDLDLALVRPAILADPGLANIETDAGRPAPANQTQGPHRYTIVVPFPDNAIVSVGQGAGHRIVDTGITGKTDSHVHWEVRKTNKTLVTLGGGATDSTITAFDDKVPKKSTGYAMVTDGPAWHDSKGQHYVVSREADVVIRSAGAEKSAVLHSDTGKVSIAAGKQVAIGSKGDIWIGADVDGVIEDKKFEKVIDGDVGKWIANKGVKTGMTAADAYFAYAAVAAKASDVQKKAKDGKDGWETESNWSKAKFIIDLGKVASTVGRYFSELVVPGKVSIMATTFAGMTGNVAASVYGNLSASLTSLVSASVLGGTASMKGFLWASVWSGIGTSIKSIKDVEVKADKGKAKMQGKTDVEISCEAGPIKLVGNGIAQLHSVTQVAFVHGKVGSYLGCGGDSGYGVYAMGDHVSIGKFTSCGDFKNASAVDDMGLLLGEERHSIAHGNARITLSKGEMAITAQKAYTVTVDSGNVSMDATKILIG